MAEKSKEEVSANKELCDSYIELYNAYKEGKKTKEDLYDITDQITEAYNLEEAAIAKLTGNYDKLTESIKKQREEELKNDIYNQKKVLKELPMGGLFETEKGNEHFTDLSRSAYVFDPKNKIILNRKESEALNILKNNANKYNTLDTSVSNDVHLKINTNNPVELVNYYNTLEKALVELGTKGLKDTATGKSIEEELNQLQSSYDDIMNAFEGILGDTLELSAKENDIENATKENIGKYYY